MGLRFRRSLKIAPGIKLNFNKNSRSITFGARGAHYTINSKGKRTSSVGIPGTGLSYSTTTTKKKRKKTKETPSDYYLQEHQESGLQDGIMHNQQPSSNSYTQGRKSPGKKNKFFVPAIIAGVIIFLAIIGNLLGDPLKSIELTAPNVQQLETFKPLTITVSTDPSNFTLAESDIYTSGGAASLRNGSIYFSASTPGKYRIYVKHKDITSNTITVSVDTKEAILAAIAKKEEEKKKAEEERKKAEEEKKKAEEEKKKAEEEKRKAEEAKKQQEAAAQASASSAPSHTTHQSNENAQVFSETSETVWITKTGSKYHRRNNCGRTNSSNARAVSRSSAEAMGLGPCDKCY